MLTVPTLLEVVFEAGRRPRNHSLLGVNEDFEVKPDAKRALLGNLYYKKLPPLRRVAVSNHKYID